MINPIEEELIKETSHRNPAYSPYYAELLYNGDSIPASNLRVLLRKHEIWCLARTLKTKFDDKRPINEIVQVIEEEYSL